MAAAKITPVRRIIAGVSDKHNVKSKSVTDNASPDVSKKIPKKIKPELKENTIPVTSNRKSKPSYNVIVPVQEAPVIDTPVTIHPNFHQNSMHQKSIENTCKNEAATISNDTSHWIPMRSSSPVLTSDISLFLKKITSKPTESSVKKRRVSKSPVRKITSPLRVVSKSHSRRYSKSPRRRRDSKSPVRRKSRSPVRRSRSPIRKRSRSPQRRRSRSPQRHRSKSPQRHRSKSSQRHRSKSPLRRRSKSPVRRRSRSPRRRSRSPIRHRSRSPRRRSRTPLRKQSRSPLRRYSRSPIRRHSRSPLRRSSRSPVKRRSRSPYRRQSRSPIKRRSRSPYRRHSRSPVKNFSNNSIGYRNVRETNADFGQSSRSREYYSPEEHPRRNMFNISKDPGLRESDIRKRDESRMLHSPRINKSDRYKSQSLSSSRGISDLDPVSDEDESIYFDKHMLSEDTNVSPSSKIMFSKLLQKFSAANNQSDPNLNNLLQFIESHKAEFEEFIALKSSSKPEKMKIDQNIQQQNLLLQQFLLANLASRIQEAGPSVSNIPFIPPQPQFVPENTSFRFGPPAMNMQAPAPIPPIPPQPAPIQPRFFPPNVNVPPPQLFQPSTQQPIQDFTPKPKPTPEVAFKDLKATVSKLFGANEGGMKQGAKPQMSSFVSTQIPDPEKWDLSHPNAPKFNAPIGSKNVFSSPVKNVNFSGGHDNRALREQVPSHHNNNAPGQFSSNSGNNRAQISNLPVPPPDAKVTFCDQPRSSSKGNLFPVVNPNFSSSTRSGVSDVKVSLAQRLASVLVKIGMVDVPAPLLQEMLMKIGAFSSSPRQDISENEILSILKRLGYLS